MNGFLRIFILDEFISCQLEKRQGRDFMMGGMKKFQVALVSLLACVGMWGCSDDVSFEWGKYRSDESIAGFIDDSLVIVTDCRRWHKNTEGWNGSYSEETSCGHDRMLIYNYRVQENGPRWTDSLTNTSGGGYWKQLTDSIIWRWDGEKQENLMLWKIGFPAIELKLKKIFESCSDDFEINRMHQWLNGTFVALGGNLSAGGDSCQYAVLDTVEKTLTYKRLDEGLEWMNACGDVRGVDEKIFCLSENVVNMNVLLYIDGSLNDSLFWEDYKNYGIYPDEFMGDMLRLGHHICSFSDGHLSKYPDTRSMYAEIKFINSNNNIITY